MTERSLLVRTAAAGRYVILGTDFPCARVFDTTTSTLAAVVTLPHKPHAIALATTSLCAVAITVDAAATQRRRAPYRTYRNPHLPHHDATNATKQHQSNNNNYDDDHHHNSNRRGVDNPKESAVSEGSAAAVAGEGCLAAMGLSDGTVVVHDVIADETVARVVLSTGIPSPLTAMVFCGPYLLALDRGGVLAILDVGSAEPPTRPCARLPVQPDATAIAAAWGSDDNNDDNGDPTGASAANESLLTHCFRVLVAGPTQVLYRIRLQPAVTWADGRLGGDDPQSHATRGSRRQEVEKLVSFASQGSGVGQVWLSPSHGGDGVATIPLSITTSADEGLLRVWDLRVGWARPRCRRTLLCGQRITNLSVGIDRTSPAGAVSLCIFATTLTGEAMGWKLEQGLLQREGGELNPLRPHLVLVSGDAAGRLLFAHALDADAARLPNFSPHRHPRQNTNEEEEDEDAPTGKEAEEEAGVLLAWPLLLLRGRFAFPSFEVTRAGALAVASGAKTTITTTTTTSTRLLGQLHRAAMGGTEKGLLKNVSDGLSGAFAAADVAWATAERYRLALKARMAPSEAVVTARPHRVATAADLPAPRPTLEEQLRRVVEARRSEKAEPDAGDIEGMGEHKGKMLRVEHVAGLGLATVPLYQALHAGDAAAVMDLLNVAGRSRAGMRATARALQLPYVLQLLHLLAQRLGIVSGRAAVGVHNRSRTIVGAGLATVSCRSLSLEWINTIVDCRGMEMYLAQLSANHYEAAKPSAGVEKNKQKKEAEEEKVEEDPVDLNEAASPPKDFIAPILHQYRSMCRQYDKLAMLHGRLSIFNAIRPSEQNLFVNRSRKMLSSNLDMVPAAADMKERRLARQQEAAGVLDRGGVIPDDILFPVMFTEVRSARHGNNHIVRVNSRLSRERKLRQAATTNQSLLRQATQLAKKSLHADEKRSGKDELLLDDAAPIEALEAMSLGSSGSDSGEEESSTAKDFSEGAEVSDEESEDPSEDRHHKKKKNRGEQTTTTMLPELASEEEEEETGVAKARRGEARRTLGDDSDDSAEFSEGSDDVDLEASEIDSDDAANDSDDEDEEEDSDDEMPPRAPDTPSGDDDDDDEGGDRDEDDDGMGEDMKELLQTERHRKSSETEADKEESRKGKRVRTD